MSDEFMRRLAPLVAEFLPVENGEEFHAYAARVREQNIGRRALIMACVANILDQIRNERQAKKSAWIAAARAAFEPGTPKACIICGRYEGLTQAHHTLPLGIQFDAGATLPVQEFDWLCPTHHVAQHVFIDDLIANVTKSIPGLPAEESDALHRMGVKMVDLLLQLPNWHLVRRQ